MRMTRTILATSAATALLVSAPFAAFAAERLDDDDYAAFGDAAGLAGHLVEVHGYTDVSCEKFTAYNEESFTVPADMEDVIALRLQGTQDGKQLWLDPVPGKEYLSPAGEGTKINWYILCTGTAPADDDDTTEEPTAPPTEEPTEPPTEEPTEPPTEEPTEPPTEEPTEPPTEEPTAPPTDEPTDPVNPPIDTDGPAQRPTDALLLLGGASLLAGVGAVAVGRRLHGRA